MAGALPPFRSPHHSASNIALLGGGAIPGPGEITPRAPWRPVSRRAAGGSNRSVLEVLRQPLEDGQVTISRSAAKITLPCSFMLVGAMNPCPCGYLEDARHEVPLHPGQCKNTAPALAAPCSTGSTSRSRLRPSPSPKCAPVAPGESSGRIRERVLAARARQRGRFAGTATTLNARMTPAQIRRHCPIDATLGDLLQLAMEKLSLSARAYDRILKVSRTIADMAEAEHIAAPHLLEAIQYRSLDRNLFY